MELAHIEYDGKSIDTKNYVELSQEEFEELRKQYYQNHLSKIYTRKSKILYLQ